MIAEVKGAWLLVGFRRRPAADLKAVEDALVQVSYLAIHMEGHLAELDINSFIVLPSGQGLKAVERSSRFAAHSRALHCHLASHRRRSRAPPHTAIWSLLCRDRNSDATLRLRQPCRPAPKCK
jgi:hypothetical protein